MTGAAPHGSPFPGLAPFDTGEAAWFFGRAREREIVLDHLLAYRLSVLFGPSGAGKSSLLRAGALPALAREEPGALALVCSDWGGGATAGLRAALRELVGADASAQAPLEELIAAAAVRAPSRLLIVLDQFEELFAGAGLDDELADAIAGAGAAVHVMIAIREDALAQLDALADAVPGLFEHVVALAPLDVEAGRAAIEQPVAAWNAATGDSVQVASELTDAVLDEVRDEASGTINAPYLQLVMRRLWEAELRPDRRVLDAGALARQGGANGIVAGHVDRAMAACSRREQAVAASMLGHLVTPSGAKLPQRVEDLALHAGVSDVEAVTLLERLRIPGRLLEPAGAGRYQLAHDALAVPLLAWRERWREGERARRERRRLAAVMGFVALLLALATLFHGLDPLELATVDARFALRGARTPPRDLLLVAIDDASMTRLGVDWPVPRRMAGDAIDWIGEGRPRVVAYDVDFSGRRPDDLSLAEAINGAHRRVVVAAQAIAPGGRVNVLGGNDVLAAIGARPGYAAFPTDLGGVIRRPLYSEDGVESFAVAAAETATGRPVAPGALHGAWLDWYGPEGTLRSVPFWKVVRHQVPHALFRDKIVVVGVTSPAIDRHPAWGGHGKEMAGVEIQATAIDTVRRGLPLRSAPLLVTLLLVAAGALLPPLLSRRRSLPITLLATAAAGALYALVSVLAFEHGIVLPVVAPLAALLLAGFAVLLLWVAGGGERSLEGT